MFQASNASQRWRSSRRRWDETRIRLGSDAIDWRLPGCDLHASRLDETVHSQEPRTSEKRVPCPERLKKECPAELGRFGKGQSLAMKVIRSIGSLSRCKRTCGLPGNETKHKGKETVSQHLRAVTFTKAIQCGGANPLRSPGTKKNRNPKHIPKQQEGTQHTLKSCECH